MYGRGVRSCAVLFGGALAIACGARPEAQLLELPSGPFQSYIISRQAEDRWTSLAATSSAAVFAPGLRDSEHLWLTTYAEELSALGLAPGLVDAGAPSCQRACSLLSPLRSYRASGDRLSWSAVAGSEVPGQLWGHLVPDADRCTSPCGKMLVRSISLKTEAAPRVVVQYRDILLVGTGDGTLLRVDPDQDLVEVWCSGLPGMEAGALLDDVLYLGGRDLVGVDLLNTVPGGPCALAEHDLRPGRDLIRSLLAIRDGNAPRLFATTSTGAVLERRGGSWRTLASLTLLPADLQNGTRIGGLALLDDQSVVGTVGGGELFRYRDAEGVSIEEPELDNKPLRIRALADGGPLGAVLAVDDVGLITKGPGGWRRMVAGGQPWSLPGVVVRVGPRYVISAFVSVLVSIYPSFGECPAATSVGLGASEAGLALGPDRAVFLDQRPGSQPAGASQALVVEWGPACGGGR